MTNSSQADFLERIHSALEAAREVFKRFTPGEIAAEYKSGFDPVTEADKAVDAVLRKELLRGEEGWLSEESVDDLARLRAKHVWVVDPLDGTREFVEGIPEFCVSIAMVEGGRPVVGGICNPATNEIFLGSSTSASATTASRRRPVRKKKSGMRVILASRSESKRGEWSQFENAPFRVQAMGSVAYKLARVSAGLADATFTLTPKNEWDIAGGAALVLSGGGFVLTLNQEPLRCNNRSPLLNGLLAGGPNLQEPLLELLRGCLSETSRR